MWGENLQSELCNEWALGMCLTHKPTLNVGIATPSTKDKTVAYIIPAHQSVVKPWEIWHLPMCVMESSVLFVRCITRSQFGDKKQYHFLSSFAFNLALNSKGLNSKKQISSCVLDHGDSFPLCWYHLLLRQNNYISMVRCLGFRVM